MGKVSAINTVYRGKELSVTNRRYGYFIVAYQLEGYLGVGHDYLLHDSRHRVALGSVLFEELSPYGDVVKYIPDNKGRTVGTACGFVLHLNASLYFIIGAQIVLALFCKYLHSGYRRDGRKCFAAETEGHYTVKIVLIGYLACCMAQKSGSHLVCRDAAAVIGNTHICTAAVFYLDCYVLRACVYGIFHKLFYHRCGALYHLACGDKLGNILSQQIYLSHAFSSLYYQASSYNSFKSSRHSVSESSSIFVLLSRLAMRSWSCASKLS